MFNRFEKQHRIPPIESEDTSGSLRFCYGKYIDATFDYESEAMTHIGVNERNILVRHGERFLNIVGGLLHARVQIGQDAHISLTNRFERISSSIAVYRNRLRDEVIMLTDSPEQSYATDSKLDSKRASHHIKITSNTGEILTFSIPYTYYDSLTDDEKTAFIDSTVQYFGALREIIDAQYSEDRQREDLKRGNYYPVRVLYRRINELHERINTASLWYDNE